MTESTSPFPPPKPKKSAWMIVSLIFIPLLILCVIALGILSIQTTLTSRSNEKTLVAANSTLSAQETALVKAAQAQDALQATLQQAQLDLETQALILSALPPGFTMTKIVEPYDGELIHDADDGKISIDCQSVEANDFVAAARFLNPYSDSVSGFDFGIRFNSYYRAVISTSPKVYLRYSQGSTSEILGSADVLNLNTGEGQYNDLTVAAFGNAVYIYLNGELVLTTYADDIPASTGEVCVGTGFFSDHEINGMSTVFSGFTIWSLP